jgi:hypothetical protein
MSIDCHEFFGCKKRKCAKFKEGEERNCWDIDPTLTPCTDMLGESIKMEDKIIFCKNCLFYEHATKTTK